MADVTDADWMARALLLAERGRGTTTPNPLVGAVVVGSSGVVVGQGAHLRAGGPHAEVIALDVAGDNARGASSDGDRMKIPDGLHRAGHRLLAEALVLANIVHQPQRSARSSQEAQVPGLIELEDDDAPGVRADIDDSDRMTSDVGHGREESRSGLEVRI